MRKTIKGEYLENLLIENEDGELVSWEDATSEERENWFRADRPILTEAL